MRKVSSAPALQDLGRKQAEQHTNGRVPKSGSTSNLRRKEIQAASKGRIVATGSLHFLMDVPVGPGTLTDFQEFSESARGLAGFDCFEKFDRQVPAPALQDGRERDDSDIGGARLPQDLNEDEADWALASCLATPYAADERNLGEQVERAARQNLQAEKEELSERVEETVESLVRDARTRKNDDRESPQRRKRRLLEILGWNEDDSKEAGSNFEGNEMAQQYLQQQAAMETQSNRLYLPEGWACNQEICHPVFRADHTLFNITSSDRRWLKRQGSRA